MHRIHQILCRRPITDLEFQLLGGVLPVDCEREEPDGLPLLLEMQVGGQSRENSVDAGIMVAHDMHGSTLARHSRLRCKDRPLQYFADRYNLHGGYGDSRFKTSLLEKVKVRFERPSSPSHMKPDHYKLCHKLPIPSGLSASILHFFVR